MLRFLANCSLGLFQQTTEDGYCIYIQALPQHMLGPSTQSFMRLDNVKKKKSPNVTDVPGSPTPADLSLSAASALLCHYPNCQQRSPSFGRKTTTLWAFYFYYHYYYFHFTNIFTGVTERCRNRHLKTTAVQRHTRRLNIKRLATEKKQRLNEAPQDSRSKLEAIGGYLAGCFVVPPQRRWWWKWLLGSLRVSVALHTPVAPPQLPLPPVCWPCELAMRLTGGGCEATVFRRQHTVRRLQSWVHCGILFYVCLCENIISKD